MFHERCNCKSTNVAKCKEYCDQDADCKGYVDKGDGSCHMATTSDCPSGCSKGVVGNVGAIDPQGNCGIDSYQGCHIKGISISNVEQIFLNSFSIYLFVKRYKNEDYINIPTLDTATAASNGGGGGGIAVPGGRKKRQLDMSTGYNYINIDVVSALREFE